MYGRSIPTATSRQGDRVDTCGDRGTTSHIAGVIAQWRNSDRVRGLLDHRWHCYRPRHYLDLFTTGISAASSSSPGSCWFGAGSGIRFLSINRRVRERRRVSLSSSVNHSSANGGGSSASVGSNTLSLSLSSEQSDQCPNRQLLFLAQSSRTNHRRQRGTATRYFQS